MKRIFVSLAGFVTMFTLMTAPAQSTVLATLTLQTQAQLEAETFMGTILKNGEHFALSDSATKTRYILDGPKKARPFEGKTGEVTGKLDLADNLIHFETVQDIVYVMV
jgi:hypothetical protein